jgi:hypothetical protein
MPYLRTVSARPTVKAMAIADGTARLTFLNRGQGWGAHMLRDMLPEIRDDGLHVALVEMLQRRETNIDLMNSTLTRLSSTPA